MARVIVLQDMRALSVLLLFATLPLPLPGQGVRTSTVLVGATVIDGTGAAPSPRMTVVIEGERIVDLYPVGAKATPPNADVRDLRGQFIIPGLIDAHAHFGPAATTNGRLQRVLSGGVTSTRVMLGDCRGLQRAREAIGAERLLPEYVYPTVIFGPAGNDDPRGANRPGPVDTACVRILDGSPVDAGQIATATKERGATAVKFYADVSRDLVQRMTAEAHAKGLGVWAHATLFPVRPSELVAAGVDVISHAAYLIWEAVDSLPSYHERVRSAPFSAIPVTHPAVERLLRLMAQRGTILDATLLFFHLRATAPDTSAEDFRGSRAAFAAALQWSAAVTRRANELGVQVAAGTDAMGAEAGHGPNLHRELELLVEQAGFSPLQALSAATRVAAKTMKIDDRVGTVAIGKQADLVILRSDPSRDIRNTRDIAFVMKRGRLVETQR
jgi:imidazolonepropionase-like amidohydrolase